MKDNQSLPYENIAVFLSGHELGQLIFIMETYIDDHCSTTEGSVCDLLDKLRERKLRIDLMNKEATNEPTT